MSHFYEKIYKSVSLLLHYKGQRSHQEKMSAPDHRYVLQMLNNPTAESLTPELRQYENIHGGTTSMGPLSDLYSSRAPLSTQQPVLGYNIGNLLSGYDSGRSLLHLPSVSYAANDNVLLLLDLPANDNEINDYRRRESPSRDLYDRVA